MHLLFTRSNAQRITFLLLYLTATHCALPQGPSAELKEADTYYRAGTAALARNDLPTALTDFQKVVHLAPKAEQGHSAVGAVLVRMGRTAEGIRELETALSILPSDSSAQMNLALTLEQNGQPAKALPFFSKLNASAHAEKRSLALPLLLSYVRALAATKQFHEATKEMKEAVERNPNNAELQDELGSLYAQQQDWPDAEHVFSLVVESRPEYAIAHLHLGLALQAENKAGSLDELAKAYQLAPTSSMIALQFGTSLAKADQDEQALPVLKHAMELNPASVEVGYQLALVLQRTGQLDEAIALLRKAASVSPQNIEIQINLGMALCQAQKAKDAVPILQRAVESAPESPTAHQDLAVAYIQLNQIDDAITQLRLALKLLPDAPQLHYNLGLALKMQDDAVGAIPELEKAQSLNPNAPEPAYILGVLYMQVGRYLDAARELNLSLKLRPENGDGWATLGSVYNKLDQLPEAASALAEAIRQLPQQPDPHLTLAAVLVKQNNATEAVQERKKAADLMRTSMNHQRAEVATNSANAQLKSGHVDEAIAQLREAISYDAGYAEAHLGLASALDRQGKSVEAAAERHKADQLQSRP
ncbi:tetratricopeptide repeat protein [Acidicapsa ligni]|uniref:tetratricopeptide repeat protein n=1 Tax=Acidicapsa ligni TaxID=542300 RepID=UPI0021E05B35|nr:tetratricopeptide repeat protein [Acidicapsa ligni]